jgi:general secretion pathway protein G
MFSNPDISPQRRRGRGGFQGTERRFRTSGPSVFIPLRSLRLCGRRGFSLVEIMIVIAINVRSYLIKAKQNVARQDIAIIDHALDSFWTVYDRFPTQEEGLAILAKPTEKFPEPLLKDVPIDPWGRAYVYVIPAANGTYDVICLGADGKEGGSGADADISSSTLRKPKSESP